MVEISECYKLLLISFPPLTPAKNSLKHSVREGES